MCQYQIKRFITSSGKSRTSEIWYQYADITLKFGRGFSESTTEAPVKFQEVLKVSKDWFTASTLQEISQEEVL